MESDIGTETEKDKNKEKYDGTKDCISAYENFDYAHDKINPKDLEDIYKDNRVPKTLEKILDPEDTKDIRT